MDDLDLTAEPPPRRRSWADVGCLALVALCAVLFVVCALAPMGDGGLDQMNVDATRIILRKLTDRIDAEPVPPGDQDAFQALARSSGFDVDAWGERIHYARACTNGMWRYTLVSYGKDGKPGGEALAADLSVGGPRAGGRPCR